MKRLFLILVGLMIYVLSSTAQGLSIKELENLCRLPWDSGQNILTNKGWSFSGSTKGDATSYSMINYAYGRIGTYAEGWFKFYIDDNDNVVAIDYLVFRDTYYNSIKESLLTNGYIKKEAKINDSTLITTYKKTEPYFITLKLGMSSKSFNTSYEIYLECENTSDYNNKPLSGVHNNHEWIDLGLPSGLLWATCNIGATNPEDYGDLFAYGETRSKSVFGNNNYYSSSYGCLSYSNDAASVNWGRGWRMPTKIEFEELINNCTWKWVTQNGKKGYKVIGPNGNSIFLPAAGYSPDNGRHCTERNGTYWSSNAGSDGHAWTLYFYLGTYKTHEYLRYWGHSIRPVCTK